MDLDFTPQEEEFRDEVRTWLKEHVPREPRPPGGPARREYELGWQRHQYDGGWGRGRVAEGDGGIGVTWEHDAHFFVKRANVLATTFGGRTQRLDDVLAAPAAS